MTLSRVALLLTFVLPSLVRAADYRLALPDGKIPELIYFDKTRTQRTVARLINYKFQSDLEDPALRKGFTVENLLRLRFEGVRLNPAAKDPAQLQVTLVGQYAEILIGETVAAQTARSGKPVTLMFHPYEKKFPVGTAVGTGNLTFQFNETADTFTLVKLVTRLRVKGLGTNEQDEATLETVTAKPGTLSTKAIKVDW